MIKFIAKIILLLILVYILQLIFVSYIPAHVEPEIAKMEKALNQKKDILYFGDSILFTTGNLPEVLQSLLPYTSVEMVAHPADSPIVFLDYCRYLSRNTYKPKVIIVPISMRTFSIEWETNPGKQFEEEKLHFRFAKTPIEPFMPFLIGFKVFKLYPRSYESFYTTPFIYKGKDLGIVNDYFGDRYKVYSDDNMRRKILLYYAYQLSSNDYVLDSIKRIADECSFSKVVFYITPLSFETGEKYLGKDFTTQTNENISVVINALQKKHALFIDMSHDLSEKDFFWDDELYMNEHVRESGRQKIAHKLADFVLQHHLLH